jgi:hypothetical protein
MKRAVLLAALLVLPGAATADNPEVETFVTAFKMIGKNQRLLESVQLDPSLPTITLIVNSALARRPHIPADEEKYRKFYDDAGVTMAYPLDVKLKADQDFLVAAIPVAATIRNASSPPRRTRSRRASRSPACCSRCRATAASTALVTPTTCLPPAPCIALRTESCSRSLSPSPMPDSSPRPCVR